MIGIFATKRLDKHELLCLLQAMDITADKIALRNAEFYSKADINILTQKQVHYSKILLQLLICT